MTGSRFAVITEFEGALPEMEQGIDRLGARSRAIDHKPVRALTLSAEHMRTMERAVLFKDEAIEAALLSTTSSTWLGTASPMAPRSSFGSSRRHSALHVLHVEPPL